MSRLCQTLPRLAIHTSQRPGLFLQARNAKAPLVHAHLCPCTLKAYSPWRLSGREHRFRVARSSLSSTWPNFLVPLHLPSSQLLRRSATCDSRLESPFTTD